jgi:hypothetical protein
MRSNYGARGPKEASLFSKRLVAYESLFSMVRSRLRLHITEQFGAEFGGIVSNAKLSGSKIRHVVNRYINDLKRLKEMHLDVSNEFEASEKKLHRSKIAAYSLKWVLQENPALFLCDFQDFDKLPNPAKTLMDDINILFAIEVVFYHLDFLDNERSHFKENGKYSRILKDLTYYIKTGFYCEKMASLLFDSMYSNSKEYMPSVAS